MPIIRAATEGVCHGNGCRGEIPWSFAHCCTVNTVAVCSAPAFAGHGRRRFDGFVRHFVVTVGDSPLVDITYGCLREIRAGKKMFLIPGRIF